MSDIDINLIGDKELKAILDGLDSRTQLIELKKILRATATATFVKALRAASPVRTGRLKASMGHVTGKNRRVATVFAGPRMSHKRNKNFNRREGYQGWVANILENAKDDDRYPKNSVAFKPFTGTAAGAEFFKKVGPIRRKTNFTGVILRTVRTAIDYETTAIRKVFTSEIKRHARR